MTFKVARDRFRYLGIQVTREWMGLHKWNLGKLVEEAREDFKRWDTLHLTLAGRVQVVKMNILPRFLFIFQALPIFIPKAFFRKVDAIISGFVWAGKVPRVGRTLLQRQRQQGGLALPNLLHYYWAANVDKVRRWWEGEGVEWVRMEEESCKGSSLKAMVTSALPMAPSKYSGSPVVQSTVKIWNQLRRHFRVEGMSVLTPLCENHGFEPGVMDNVYRRWREVGLAEARDLYLEGGFASLEELRERVELPRGSEFRYLQVRDLARKVWKEFPRLPRHTLLERLLLPDVGGEGSIGDIYKWLGEQGGERIVRIKEKWEAELGMEINWEVWSEALRRVNGTSSCARMSLIQFKVLHRVHMTRAKMSGFFQGVVDECERCGRGPANHAHMFWGCEKLGRFWEGVFTVLARTVEEEMDPDPLVAIFGVSEKPGLVEGRKADVVAFASLIARRRILLEWRSASPPGVATWLSDLQDFLRLEKIKYEIRGSIGEFEKRWGMFVTLFEELFVAGGGGDERRGGGDGG